ncbi:MAG: VOC family protein [Myxococcales bacterium]|nr:VOC family protein [Myxococcales bacterium]MCA9712932.1 VOC family protein [Myxococcales bacterium]
MSIHEVFPYLRVRGGEAAIAFYREAFGATELFRLVDPSDGRIGHAELRLSDDAILMLSDEYPEMGILSPQSVGGVGMSIHLHVDDADAAIARAAAAGAEVMRPPTDQFYGERGGTIVDPFGHTWDIGHSIEEVEPAEMQRRWDAMHADASR